MQKIGAIIKRQGKNTIFNEDEVTGKSIKMMNINEILQAIEVYEDNFENKISLGMVNSLLELYQQAIEYFAAVSDSKHGIFLQRMHILLENENVLALLQGKPLPENSEVVVIEVKSQKMNILDASERTREEHRKVSEEKKNNDPQNFNEGHRQNEVPLITIEEKDEKSIEEKEEKSIEEEEEKEIEGKGIKEKHIEANN